MTTMRPDEPSSSFSPGGAFTTWSGTTAFRGDGLGSFAAAAAAPAAVEKDFELPDVACSSTSPSSSSSSSVFESEYWCCCCRCSFRRFSISLWTDSL